MGGTNSGHTVYKGNQKFIFRLLPTGIIEEHVCAVLPAGSYIDLEILEEEVRTIGLSKDRLFIDGNAVIITEKNKRTEAASGLRQAIGSTNSGTWAAIVERIRRKGDVFFAKNCNGLKEYIVDTKHLLRKACDSGEKVIIEGTQGYGLSLLHAEDYPYATSRDTSAAGFLAETGLSPFDVENIIMVIRTFPIRVSGNSGPLKNEIDWEILRKELGCDEDMTEYTSCTNRVRRVARFDKDVVLRAIECNRPNIIVLNHLDYIASGIRQKTIAETASLLKRPVDYFGENPFTLSAMI
ncbi:MAG: adenylosuccinate synthetase [Spirochaetaceae bacterium]|nr:adenylosuccinate synthetase [Spirochaetaceae bacterium]